MVTAIKNAKKFLLKDLWSVDLGSLNSSRAFLVKSARFFSVIARELTGGQLTLMATSLVYTTLLSLVPLLAVSFSVLKGFGVYYQTAPLLMTLLEPLGPNGEELVVRILEFVSNMKVGVLGSVGLVFLMYTVVSLVVKIEESINYIWKITRHRTLARRFSDYMSVLLVGPILVFSGVGLSVTVMSADFVQGLISVEPFGLLFYLGGKILPYVFVCSAFTMIYIFIPSVKVRLRSAVVGGVIAGILWESAQWGFAVFVATSTKYTAIYSGFAILLMFMIWLYVSWLILLLGALVTYYHQYPQFLLVKNEALLLSNRLKERLALSIMFLVGYNYHKGLPPWTLDTIVARLETPVEPVNKILGVLTKSRLLSPTAGEPQAYLPARELEAISLMDVLDCARRAGEDLRAAEARHLSMPEVDRVTDAMRAAITASVGGETLKDLVLRGDGDGAGADAPAMALDAAPNSLD